MKKCVFCLDNQLLKSEIYLQNTLFYICSAQDTILQHSGLIIPFRHIETPFKFTEKEWQVLQQTLQEAKKYFNKFNPQGYNIGWNVGAVAGQTVKHVHLHIIARFEDEPYSGRGIKYHLRSKENKRKDK